jgi:hypothetical protein
VGALPGGGAASADDDRRSARDRHLARRADLAARLRAAGSHESTIATDELTPRQVARAALDVLDAAVR